MPKRQDLTNVQKQKNTVSNNIQENSLAFTMPILAPNEALELIDSCGKLGTDPSSDYFTTRTKNIAYVLCLQGEWFQLHANYFIQSENYNDFSGGYKRCYQEMPQQFLESEATKKVLDVFKSTYNIPDGEPILVQVQQSHVTAETTGKCLTGQGIHSDGADRGILVCLQRNNIKGAESAIYADINGKRSLINPFILNEGHAILWHDNQVFHDVQPAQPIDPEKKGTRTILIAHYPAIHYLKGTVNPNNTLGTHTVNQERRLRNKF
ncbi:MAG: 2OG-Fe dioxygenase family protein [Cyanobacteria bacterium P01_F01_bin.143]